MYKHVLGTDLVLEVFYQQFDTTQIKEYNVFIKIWSVFKEIQMSKTLTLRIDDNIYERLKEHAKCENRNLSNFIETAVIKYIEQIEFTDEQETSEILGNSKLLERLKKGSSDAADGRGRFV